MNAIQKINAINQKELESNVSDSGSWHADYKDTPYIFIGFIPQELEEHDIVAIFSQYGIPTHINLVKDRETGKSRGFCYLKYEDHRSCVLAIDNLNGIQVFEKKLKVDHVRYKLRDGENESDYLINYSAAIAEKKKEIQVEKKLPIENVNEDDEFRDPMADFVNRDKSPTRHTSRSDGSKSERHSSDRRRSDSHRSRSRKHESSGERSSRERDERSSRSGKEGRDSERSSHRHYRSDRGRSHRRKGSDQKDSVMTKQQEGSI